MALVYLWLVRAPWLALDRTKSGSAGSLRGMVEAFVLFAFVYVLSGFGNAEPAFLAVFFLATFVARWAVAEERGFLLVVAVLLAIGGMVGEGLLAEFDLVAYREPEIFHVPWWLGGLYMHGAFALREGMRFMALGKR